MSKAAAARLALALAVAAACAVPAAAGFSAPIHPRARPTSRVAMVLDAPSPLAWAATVAKGLVPFAPRTEQLEARLRELASGDKVRETLEAFEALERAAPPPADLLRAKPELLDGRWSLIGTFAAEAGVAVSETNARAGVVNASGIAVDASSGALPVQEICVRTGRIGNEVLLSKFGQTFYLRVAGGFSAAEPPAPGTRALVNFDSLEVFTRGGRRLLSAGWLFSLVRKLKPGLQNGAEDASWLETTYVSETMRLGRGNKGSVFVLERLRDGGGPLAESPL